MSLVGSKYLVLVHELAYVYLDMVPEYCRGKPLRLEIEHLLAKMKT